MTGFFWRKPDCFAFGVFTPSLRGRFYHVADPLHAPGIKLWSDGTGRDEPWVTQYTLNGEQCLEIQAGPAGRSIGEGCPAARAAADTHIEFWIAFGEGA